MTSNGYALNYAKYATGWITPEFGFWKNKNGVQGLSETEFPNAMEQTYKLMNVLTFFNRNAFASALFNPQSTILAFSSEMGNYLRMITTNFGYQSLLQQRTPREMIEGYNAPLYKTLNDLKLVKGGDKTLEPFLALSRLPTRPMETRISLFTGQDHHNMTRSFNGWMNSGSIVMNGT